MMLVERGVALGVVQAPVCTPALGALERAARKQLGQRMGIVEQPVEALGGADDARVSPQLLARLGGGERRRWERLERLDLRGRGRR